MSEWKNPNSFKVCPLRALRFALVDSAVAHSNHIDETHPSLGTTYKKAPLKLVQESGGRVGGGTE